MKYGVMKFENNGTLGCWAVEVYEVADGHVVFRTGTVQKYNGHTKHFSTTGSPLRTLPVSGCILVECDVLSGKEVLAAKNRLNAY